MILALLCTWGICVTNHYQIKFGTGRHVDDQPAGNGTVLLEGTLKSWYVYQIAYLVDLSLVKFSILAFYRVIATQKMFRFAVDTTIAIVAAFTIAMVFVNAFECPKPSDAWSAEILLQGSGSCINLHPLYYGQAAFNILSDIVILALPVPVLWSLQMHRNKRIALVAIFSVGFVAVIASIIRVYALHVYTVGTDTPYNGAYILLWSQIEINVAIISASIPSLKPLFKRTFGSTIKSTTGGRYIYGYGGGRSNMNKQGASIALKRMPSSASMQQSHKRNRSFSNASDEQIFFKDGLDTKIEGGVDDLERQWDPETSYALPRERPTGQILRSVKIEHHSVVELGEDHTDTGGRGGVQRGPLVGSGR
ncbi:hypothetical protein K432DRAFT_76178 [Lepidopterella palustris CBS 459.81]|uniref:Rhodopsin domain-containing protein n=1 Tax=Lepidopterella palustris CBS 459.81 TaxID=1314670 RepID=A0A8E2E8F2_9PEZI|nr:hypothetical protein K432DRAFT_76178 [Lepidopterella palustris CBS 459.81]